MPPIPPPQAVVLRSIKRTAIIILVMIRLKTCTANEIGDILEMDPHTVGAHLRSLEKIGLVFRLNYRQWCLTLEGQQLAFPFVSPSNEEIPHFSAPIITESSLLSLSDSDNNNNKERNEGNPHFKCEIPSFQPAHIPPVGAPVDNPVDKLGITPEETTRRTLLEQALLSCAIMRNRRTEPLYTSGWLTWRHVLSLEYQLRSTSRNYTPGLLIVELGNLDRDSDPPRADTIRWTEFTRRENDLLPPAEYEE